MEPTEHPRGPHGRAPDIVPASRSVVRHDCDAFDWADRAGAVDELVGELRQRAGHRRRRRMAWAGAAVVLFLAAAGGWRLTRPVPLDPIAGSQTLVTTPARQILVDGSVVELNQDAAITVQFTPATRRVRLERGVAHFAVRKDPSRPFIVQVGEVEVRAVGTEFAVDFTRPEAEVLVTEGIVAIEKPAAPMTTTAAPRQLALLPMGKRATVSARAAPDATARIDTLSPAEIADSLSWRIPRLEFSGTPLADAVAMFNRHNPVQFTLEEVSLGQLKVSGFLRTDQIETFVRLLESDFGLTAERRGASEIVLKRAR